jgi:hypothetical protein
MKYEIGLSGKGGQGLVLVGIILEKPPLSTKIYMPCKSNPMDRSPSGASRSDVIISDLIEYLSLKRRIYY